MEPEGCPTLHAALAAGGPVDVEVGGIAADSLGARRVGDVCWAVARETGLRSVLVPDDAVARVRRRLWGELRVLAEYGGAAALAPLLTGAYLPERGERVAAVVCGGNTDRPRSPDGDHPPDRRRSRCATAAPGRPRAVTSPGARLALERADDVVGDPAAVEAAGLGAHRLAVDRHSSIRAG